MFFGMINCWQDLVREELLILKRVFAKSKVNSQYDEQDSSS